MKKSKITLHMVSSLDGYIAKNNNDISWMNITDKYDAGIKLNKQEIEKFLKSIDCYVMGSRTYEHALKLGWAYGDTPTFVITSRKLLSTRKSVEFYSGDLKKFAHKLSKKYDNIWLVGGAVLCQEFLKLGLVDEISLVVMPILLGDGISLFGNSGIEKKLHLKDQIAYKNGTIELRYAVIKNN